MEDDQRDERHAEGRVKSLLNGVEDRVLDGVAVEHEEFGAVCRGEEHVGEEIAPQSPGVSRGHHHAVRPRPQAAAREGHDQVAEKAEVAHVEEVAEGKRERRRQVGQVLDEPGETDRHHENARPVVGAPPPGRAPDQHVGQPASDVQDDRRPRLTGGMVEVVDEREERDGDPDQGCRKRQRHGAGGTGCAGKGGRLDHGGIVTRAGAGRSGRPHP